MNDSQYQIVACDYCKQRNRLVAEGRRNFCGRCGYPLTRMLTTSAAPAAARSSNGWLKTFLVVAVIVLLLRGLAGGLSSHRSSYAPPYASPTGQQACVAENGSYFGEISTVTGRPKTVHINSYHRADGSYVREHFRSPPR